MARLWLTIVVGVQVFLAPAIAFTITYIIAMDWENYTFKIQVDLLPWIMSAAAIYGFISLTLGLGIGGYMHPRIADAGGWRAAFGFTRRRRDAELVDRARLHLFASPYGNMLRIVHREVRRKGRPLLEVHGGLQILAAPLQVCLMLTPIIVLKVVPDGWLQPGSLLELALVIYLASLVIGLRLLPKYCERMVGMASMIRRILVDRTKIGWLFPILVLWLVQRTIVSLAFQGLDLDLSKWQEIQVEQQLIEAVLPVAVEVPETSFLDLLVALSVLPSAIFITMAVMGGGEQEVPRWLLGTAGEWRSREEAEGPAPEDASALPAPGEASEAGAGTDVHLTEEEAESIPVVEAEEAEAKKSALSGFASMASAAADIASKIDEKGRD